MKMFLLRGVPASIQQDGWWMDGFSQSQPRKDKHNTEETLQGRLERPLMLLALIALGDLLLWGVAPGLSLALFGICVLGVAWVISGTRHWGGLLLGLILSLPVVEKVQFLSVTFWLAGLLMGGAWFALGGWRGLRETSLAACRLLAYGPVCSVVDALRIFSRRSPTRSWPEHLARLALGWTLPVGLGLIFLSLLIQANPVAQSWLDRVQDFRVPQPDRLLFWAGVALMVWPFLRLTALRQRLTPVPRTALIGPQRRPAILNPDAVRRSLILFNLIFAMQTGMDFAYLWGGATLPEGMSHAAYAHRGAYPLLFTALLAGGFALIARPFTGTDPLLPTVLMVWLLQTVFLVVSSLMRLELYIEAYGLTRLRLAAGLWMAVVATGLGLTMWQVLRHHSASWLLKRCALLGIVTLYAVMFLSFDRTIAGYNLTHDVPLDQGYICRLGPAALPEIRTHAPDLCDYYPQMRAPLITDWREWGFRDWRVLRSLASINATRTEQSTQNTWPTF